MHCKKNTANIFKFNISKHVYASYKYNMQHNMQHSSWQYQMQQNAPKIIHFSAIYKQITGIGLAEKGDFMRLIFRMDTLFLE